MQLGTSAHGCSAVLEATAAAEPDTDELTCRLLLFRFSCLVAISCSAVASNTSIRQQCSRVTYLGGSQHNCWYVSPVSTAPVRALQGSAYPPRGLLKSTVLVLLPISPVLVQGLLIWKPACAIRRIPWVMNRWQSLLINL